MFLMASGDSGFVSVAVNNFDTLKDQPASAAATPLADGTKPQNKHIEASSTGGRNGITPASNLAVRNASLVAAAKATEGYLECRHVGCDMSVPPSKRKRGAKTCGRTNCAKNT